MNIKTKKRPSPEGLEGWHKSMASLSKWPNVVVKISYLGLAGIAWTSKNNECIAHHI